MKSPISNTTIFIILLISLISSCKDKDSDNPYENFINKNSSIFFLFDKEKLIQEQYEGQIKSIKAKETLSTGESKEEELYFDNLGRLNKHKYTAFNENEHKLEPTTEIFTYYDTTENTRERLKYIKEKLTKRDLFLYEDNSNLLSIHYQFDENNNVIFQKTNNYNSDKNLTLSEIQYRDGRVELEKRIYRQDGSIKKMINTNSSGISIDYNYNDKGTLISISRISNNSNENTEHVIWSSNSLESYDNSQGVILNDIDTTNQFRDKIKTSDSTTKFIHKYPSYNKNMNEQVVEQTYDKKGNCVKYVNTINGQYKSSWEAKIEYYNYPIVRNTQRINSK